jgi:hypothetical protein
MNILTIGNTRIPSFDHVTIDKNMNDSTRFRVAVLLILGTYVVFLYIKTKQNEKKIKEIIKGRSVDV